MDADSFDSAFESLYMASRKVNPAAFTKSADVSFEELYQASPMAKIFKDSLSNPTKQLSIVSPAAHIHSAPIPKTITPTVKPIASNSFLFKDSQLLTQTGSQEPISSTPVLQRSSFPQTSTIGNLRQSTLSEITSPVLDSENSTPEEKTKDKTISATENDTLQNQATENFCNIDSSTKNLTPVKSPMPTTPKKSLTPEFLASKHTRKKQTELSGGEPSVKNLEKSDSEVNVRGKVKKRGSKRRKNYDDKSNEDESREQEDTNSNNEVDEVIEQRGKKGKQEKMLVSTETECDSGSEFTKEKPECNALIKSKNSSSHKRPIYDTPKSSLRRSRKQFILHEWIIKPVKFCKGVMVEGRLKDAPDGEFWHSSAIVKRQDPMTVVTQSGSVYKLRGEMDKKEALAIEGFSKRILESFVNGFPGNWRQLIQEHFGDSEISDLPVSQPENKAEEKTKRKRKTSSKHLNIDINRELKSLKSTLNARDVKKKRRGAQKSNISTEAIDVDQLPRTRSGRRVFPQLVWWANQRIKSHSFTDCVEVTPPSSAAMKTPFLNNSLTEFKTDERHVRTRDRYISQMMEKKKPKKQKTFNLCDSDSDGDDTQETQEAGQNTPKLNKEKSPFSYKTKSKNGKYRSSESEASFARSLATDLFTDEHTKSEGKSENSRKTNDLQTNANKDLKKHSVNVDLFSNAESDDTAASELFIPDPKVKRDTIPEDCLLTPQNSKSPAKKTDIDLASYSLEDDVANLLDKQKKERLSKQLLRAKKSACYSSFEKRQPKVVIERSCKDLEAALRNKGTCSVNSANSRKGGRETRKQNSETNSESKAVKKRSPREDQSDTEEEQTFKRITRSAGSNFSRHKSYRDSQSEEDEDFVSTKRMTRSSEKTKHVDGIDSNKRKISQKRKRKSSKETIVSEEIAKKKSNKTDQAKDFEVERNDIWSKNEIDRLYKAVNSINPATPMFWHVVSDAVNTRTATECQEYYHKDLENLTKKNKGKEKVAAPNPKVTELCGKVGTMKRKRQLREMMMQHDQGYEDDFFDSTPYRNLKTIQVSNLDDSELEDGHHRSRTLRRNSNYYTPKPSSLTTRTPISEKKTPHSNLISPGIMHSVNRNDIDQYINKLKKGKRGRALQEAAENARAKERRLAKASDDVELQKALHENPNIFQKQQSKSLDIDSDEEMDYYWSSGEEEN